MVFAGVERLLSKIFCFPRMPLSRSFSQREQSFVRVFFFLSVLIHVSGFLVELFNSKSGLNETK